MPLKHLARAGFAVGLGGLGVLGLLNDDFAMNWQPVPPGVPLHAMLAYLSGVILFAGGVGLLVKRTARVAAPLLAWFVLLWLVLLQAPRVAAHPTDIGAWLGFGENLLLVTGGWAVVIALGENVNPKRRWLNRETARRADRMLFGLALPMIGASHFKYLDATASMVPGWLPAHHVWACLTGAGHIAAGLALVLGVLPRLAATMEAGMITCFVLLLHLPGVLAAPGSRLQWTMLCVATALASAAWAVAAEAGAQDAAGSGSRAEVEMAAAGGTSEVSGRDAELPS